MRIGVLLVAPSTYRHLPNASWWKHGDVHAELRWQVGRYFTSDIIRLKDSQLGSPAAARAAIGHAARTLRSCHLLILGVAGHCFRFARRNGEVRAFALPGSVPGRPGSMLPVQEMLAAVGAEEADQPMVLCADLVTGDEVTGIFAGVRSASLLCGRQQLGAELGQTCHDALGAALGDLAAAGSARLASAVLQAALSRNRQAGGNALLQDGPHDVLLTSTTSTPQLPDYVREDLWSVDPGSRLDAVTELAAMSAHNAFAEDVLRHLAGSDRAEAVRSYADTLLRQSEQPALSQLLATGRIPQDVYDAAVKNPQVPELLPQPGGVAVIGVDAPDGQSSCRPRHLVRLAPYQMSRMVVTNRQYLAFLAAQGGPCPAHWDSDEALWGVDDLPVVMVSWLDAARYCRWLTGHLHRAGKLAPDDHVALPSEVEWENAARNGRGDRHPWGDAPDPRRANIRATGLGTVVPSGRFSPAGDNDVGCQDLIGNVWEWTRSLWGHGGHRPSHRYPYQPHDGREVATARSGARYVIRGGAFYYATDCANSFTRNRMLATDRHPAGGFRVVAMNSRSGTASR